MTDIISFDVELTQNQKLAQDKLNQVHQLYDEIEKVLGTQGVFKRPHLFMALPKKEPQTNEEWLRSCPPQELIRFLMNVAYGGQIRNVQKRTFDEEAEKWSKWLKEKHTE